MSRTHNTKPWRFREYGNRSWTGENEPKLPKRVDTEWHWMSTPGWWIRMMMNRPKRACENQSLHCIVELETFDFVDTGRKPHKYYW
jgi:hypothetical protein